MLDIAYSLLALMECDIYSLVDVPAAPTRCHPCSDIIFNCLICNDLKICTYCMVGWPVTGGCTNVSQCISVVQNYSTNTSTCTACSSGIISNSSLCPCPTGFWFVTSHCTNIIGCIATRLVGSQVICLTCDLSKRL